MSREEDVKQVQDWFSAAVSLVHVVQNPNLAYGNPAKPAQEAKKLLDDAMVVSVRDALNRLGDAGSYGADVIVGEADFIHAAVPLIVAMAPHDARSLEDRTAEVIRALVKGAARGFAARDPNVCTTCNGLKRVKYTDAGWCTCPGCSPIVHLSDKTGALKCRAEPADAAKARGEESVSCPDCLHSLLAEVRGTA